MAEAAAVEPHDVIVENAQLRAQNQSLLQQIERLTRVGVGARPLTKPVLLLVEGNDEERLLNELFTYMQLTDIQVLPYAGKTQLSRYLPNLLDASGYANVTTLAVMRDADDDPAAAFQSVRDVLAGAGLAQPTRPGVWAAGSPRVQVFIAPAANQTGALEDLCLAAMTDDPAMPCVDQYMACLDGQGLKPRSLGKARMQAFLASRPKSVDHLGEAAKAGYFPWANSGFALLRQFLSDLAVDPPG